MTKMFLEVFSCHLPSDDSCIVNFLNKVIIYLKKFIQSALFDDDDDFLVNSL